MRTWAPKGETPVLQYSFTWNQLSAVAGVSFWNIYFKLVQGAVRAPEVVAFLRALRRHLAERKLLIVWDRLQAHRSRLVREYVESQDGAIHLEFLPPYAPELNPDEYVWNDLKSQCTGRKVINSPTQLRQMIVSHMRQLQKLPMLVRSFFHAPTTRYACA